MSDSVQLVRSELLIFSGFSFTESQTTSFVVLPYVFLGGLLSNVVQISHFTLVSKCKRLSGYCTNPSAHGTSHHRQQRSSFCSLLAVTSTKLSAPSVRTPARTSPNYLPKHTFPSYVLASNSKPSVKAERSTSTWSMLDLNLV